MMLGAAGALCCMAAGTAVGSWLRERRAMRYALLQAQIDAVTGMRLLLEQERPAMPQLLLACAGYAAGAERFAQRLTAVARLLTDEPLTALDAAYAEACRQFPLSCEQAEERAIMERLFRQLGSGTADMRGQAAAACIRRLKPLAESARQEAERDGKLCIQLGLLLGLMAGIALW